MHVVSIDPLVLNSQLVCSAPKEPILQCQCSLVAYSSLCRLEVSRTFPHHLVRLLVLSLFNSCLGSHAGEALWVKLLTFLQDTVSQLWFSGFYNLSASFSTMFYEP